MAKLTKCKMTENTEQFALFSTFPATHSALQLGVLWTLMILIETSYISGSKVQLLNTLTWMMKRLTTCFNYEYNRIKEHLPEILT